jgi:hypothetical protein
MANTTTSNEPTNQIDEDPSKEAPAQAAEGEEEFKITVKKLDFVVKPRGVLAE